MKKRLFSLVMALVMAMTLTAGLDFSAFADDNQAICVPVVYCQSEARKLPDMVNGFRTGDNAWFWDEAGTTKVYYRGLKALAYDYDLEAIAMRRAAEIAVYYDHYRPDGTICFTAYDSYQACGENIACGYTSAEAVFEAWQEEGVYYDGQGHRRTMLSDKFTAIGTACVYFNKTYYWVQEFRNPIGNTTATPAIDAEAGVNMWITPTILNSVDPTSKLLLKAATATPTPAVTKIDPATTKPANIKEVQAGTPTNRLPQHITYFDGEAIVADENGELVSKKMKKPTLTKLVRGKKIFTAKWKKNDSVSGYQIQYLTSKKFTKKTTKKVYSKGNKKMSKAVKKLKSGKKYYVRVRTYQNVEINGKTKKIYSGWSKVKNVTVK